MRRPRPETARTRPRTVRRGRFRRRARRSASLPSNATAPPASATRRSACSGTSSTFCVVNTTAPPPRGHGRDEVPHQPPLPRVERRGRLVQQQHVGVADQTRGDVGALRLPDRQLGHALVGDLGQGVRGEHLLDAVVPAQLRDEAQVLPHGQPAPEGRLLRHVPDAAGRRDASRTTGAARRPAARAASTCRPRSGPPRATTSPGTAARETSWSAVRPPKRRPTARASTSGAVTPAR